MICELIAVNFVYIGKNIDVQRARVEKRFFSVCASAKFMGA